MQFLFVLSGLFYFFGLNMYPARAVQFTFKLKSTDLNSEKYSEEYSIDVPEKLYIGNPEIILLSWEKPQISDSSNALTESICSTDTHSSNRERPRTAVRRLSDEGPHEDWPKEYTQNHYQFKKKEDLYGVNCFAFNPENRTLYPSSLSYLSPIFANDSHYIEHVTLAENRAMKKCNKQSEGKKCFLIGCEPLYQLQKNRRQAVPQQNYRDHSLITEWGQGIPAFQPNLEHSCCLVQ